MLNFQIYNIFGHPNDPFLCSKEKKCSLKEYLNLFIEVLFIEGWICLLRRFHHLNGTDITVLKCLFKFIPVLS